MSAQVETNALPDANRARPSALGRPFVIVALIAAGLFILHMVTIYRYGYFRDELYYIACSQHLDWGYVDQPPLIAVITWLVRHLFGNSLLALRLAPAIAMSGLVILTAAIARELGGGRWARGLAALTVACAGIYLILGHLLTMNAFEPLLWMGCALVIVRMIKRADLKLWVWFGVLAGVGLENKYSIGVFAFGMIAGLLLTRQRKLLFSPWLLAGGVIALLIFLPNLIWNVGRHFPFVELMHNIKESGRDIALGPIQYILQQILLMNPAIAPIWIGGVVYLLFARDGKPFRALGWAYLIMLGVFIVLSGKNYYLAPAYPMLLAAGSVGAEKAFERWRAGWLKPAVVAAILIITGLLLPALAPVLSVQSYLDYQDHLPFTIPRNEKSHLGAALPQYYADDFGWEEMTAAVARIYNSLSPEERAVTAIYCSNYGEAGAIDFFGPKYGLPKAISGHQNYFLWGPRAYTGEIMIMVGDRLEEDTPKFKSVEVAASLDSPYAIPGENGPVLLCRGLKADLRQVWPSVKKWE